MERPLPRRRAPLLARRRRAARRNRDQDRRLARRVRGARRRPSKSVNFVVAHDGFTLRDLVSYAHKHNEANGENNRDGTDNNSQLEPRRRRPERGSGDRRSALARRAQSADAAVHCRAARRCSSMGTELGFSQGGNNNAYAQDNATSAIDWRAADASLIAFTARLIKARRSQPGAVARRLPDRGAVRRERPCRRRMARRRRADDRERLERSGGRGSGCGLRRAARRRRRSRRGGDEPVERGSRNPPAARRAPAWRGAPSSTPTIRRRPSAELRSPTACGFTPAPRSFLPRRRRRAAAAVPARPAPRRSTRSPSAAGIAGEWWDVGGKRTIVSPETKIALLTALGLEVGSEAEARESLTRLIDETHRRRLPFSLVLRLDEPPVAPLRDLPRAAPTRASYARTARSPSGGSRPATAPAATCLTGAPSPSARSRCRRCRSAAIGSSSMASNAR